MTSSTSQEQTELPPSFGTPEAAKVAAVTHTNGKAKPKPFSRSMMQDFVDRTTVRVELQNDKGESYYINIRDLPAEEADQLQNMFGDVETDETGKPKNNKDTIRKMVGVIARSAVDDDGSLLFTEPEDLDWLMRRPFKWVSKCFMAVLDVNALTANGIEEQKKS